MQASFTADEGLALMEYWFPRTTQSVKEKSFNEGLKKGMAQANQSSRQTIARILQKHFGKVGPDLLADLGKIDDREQLADLAVLASTARSLDEVRLALRKYLDKA